MFVWHCFVIVVALVGVVQCSTALGEREVTTNIVVTAVASIVFFIVVLIIIVIIVILVIRRKRKSIPGVILSRGGDNKIVPAGMMALQPGSIVVNNPNQLYPPSAVGWGQGYANNLVPSVAYVGQFQVHHPPPPSSEMDKMTLPEILSKPPRLTQTDCITLKEKLPAEDAITLLECVDLTSLTESDYKLQSDETSSYNPNSKNPAPTANIEKKKPIKKDDSLDIISIN